MSENKTTKICDKCGKLFKTRDNYDFVSRCFDCPRKVEFITLEIKLKPKNE